MALVPMPVGAKERKPKGMVRVSVPADVCAVIFKW